MSQELEVFVMSLGLPQALVQASTCLCSHLAADWEELASKLTHVVHRVPLVAAGGFMVTCFFKASIREKRVSSSWNPVCCTVIVVWHSITFAEFYWSEGSYRSHNTQGEGIIQRRDHKRQYLRPPTSLSTLH